MQRHVSKDTLKKLILYRDISKLDINQIHRAFVEDESIHEFAPDGYCQVDPRNGDRIVYNSARARRPHDNRPLMENQTVRNHKKCLICEGNTTEILDIAPLSEGFTFINKNLFPVFFPFEKPIDDSAEFLALKEKKICEHVSGYHFLQWTSSLHDKDWQNMPQADRIVVMQRLAALEKKFLNSSNSYVSIIKNYGHLVGGSLAHGHQQIGVSNIMPNRLMLDIQFREKFGETFSNYMLRENPTSMLIKDYGSAVLITPYFMRRPYDMVLLFKDTSKSQLHDLNAEEISAASDGWQDAIRIMMTVMPQIGKEIAYNVTTHNGPGSSLYFEFLPYTQEMGGFEHLGLYLCQGDPEEATLKARKILVAYND